MRILIDLQGAQNGSRHRGIGRYSLALAKAVTRNAGKHQVFILLNGLFVDTIEDIKKSFAGILPESHFLVFMAPGPVDELRPENTWRRHTAELLREHLIDALAPDVLLIGSLVEGAEDDTITSIGRITSSVAVAVVLYDLIPLTDPDRYIGWEPARNWYHGKIDSMRRSDLLLAISNAAADEAIRMLGVESARITNISSAADDSFSSTGFSSSEIADVTRRFGIDRRYLMHSSAFEPRKNFQGLIKAFAALPEAIRKDFQLVLVCKLHGAGRAELEELARVSGLGPGELVLTGYVVDTDLIALYAGCHLFVFPSFHEGFGLPALEAMCCGAPVIGSNLTSIPEVIGRDDALFDPTSIESITAAIRRVLTDPSFYQSLKKHAMVQAAKFSWDKTAQRAIAALEDLYERRGPRSLDSIQTADLASVIEMMAEVSSHAPPADAEIFELARCIGANENAVTTLKASADFSGPLTWRLEGPFDSTYSLALLNRETARALSALGHTVVLHSTEGPGDFPANKAFLELNPDLAVMHARVPDHPHETVDVVSRNLYPPRVKDMQGRLNLLHHYAWEESGFPQAWAAEFNAHLEELTCLSTHVEKILLDNGIQVPMTTSGCGVDHWERVVPTPGYRIQGRGFRFLHVSSCFPRKGIDALLDAFGKAFTDADNVTLIVKTFANPHNEVHALLARRRSLARNYPDVEVIEQDLSDSDLKALYQGCHALVAPSRAEGFGLPLAEAMLSGLPVITTAWSGQLDFCNDQTAWLVDYSFRRAETHFGVFASVWAEPDVDALARTLSAVRSTPSALLRARALAGRAVLLDRFKWIDVAARLVTASRALRPSVRDRAARIGWITTWNTKCGIASYSEHLIAKFPQEVMVLAPHQEGRLRDDAANCIRCWLSSKDENGFEELNERIDRNNLDTLVLQFNYGFFNFRQLSHFISRQIDDRRIVIVMMHSTGDPELLPAWNWSLTELAPALARCHRVLVHSIDDLNRLKRLGLVSNVALFPHGVLSVEPHRAPREGDVLPLIAAYGYCLPHKGLIELVYAVDLLRKSGSPMRLRLVNAEYPDPVSAQLVKELRALVKKLSLDDLVEMHHEYLEDDDSLRLLQEADLLVFPYQETNESSSAAVRYGLATKRPVAVTPLRIFDDLGGAVHRLSGVTPQQVAEGISSALTAIAQQTDAARATADEAQKWLLAHSHAALSRRLHNICAALSRARRSSSRVLDGSNRRLRTSAGKIQGRSIVSTGEAGYLLFGPYLELPPGRYEVVVTGSYRVPQGSRADLDIVLNGGKKVLAHIVLDDVKSDVVASASIRLERRCHDLEIRVRVDERAQCRIDRIEILSWMDRPAEGSGAQRIDHEPGPRRGDGLALSYAVA